MEFVWQSTCLLNDTNVEYYIKDKGMMSAPYSAIGHKYETMICERKNDCRWKKNRSYASREPLINYLLLNQLEQTVHTRILGFSFNSMSSEHTSTQQQSSMGTVNKAQRCNLNSACIDSGKCEYIFSMFFLNSNFIIAALNSFSTMIDRCTRLRSLFADVFELHRCK